MNRSLWVDQKKIYKLTAPLFFEGNYFAALKNNRFGHALYSLRREVDIDDRKAKYVSFEEVQRNLIRARCIGLDGNRF